ncbi:MAG: alkaline phosphatase family protein [Chloroflexi bacterium]|nr:alkaline phosphatase family protein [Chloroflexota bacterium]
MAKTRRLFVIGYDGMNYPLLRRFIDEGVLPTFKALLGRGSLNRLLPTMPPWTPTNWSSLVTGAPSGTTRLGGWTVRDKTAPWDTPLTMSWDYNILGGAETLWEVADQVGLKTLITHYPSASWGVPLKHGYVVAPGIHDAPLSYALAMRYFATVKRDVQTRVDTSGLAMAERTTDVEEEGAPPGSSIVRLEPAGPAGWRNVGPDDFGCPLAIVLRPGAHAEYAHAEYVYLLVRRGSDGRFERVAVCAEPDASTLLVEVHPGGWSPFAHHRVGPEKREAAMRFRILAVNSTAGSLHLVRSVVYGTRGFTQPPGLDAEILKHCGPFYDVPAVSPATDDEHLATWLDELRFMGEWEVKVARYIQNRSGWDLHFSHWHPFDWVNHATVNDIDPENPSYDPRRAEWLLDAQRKTYVLSDDILAQFLELEREGDLVCVISDHAMAPSQRGASIPDRLIETGLMVLGPDGQIDRSRSRAYLVAARGSEIYVNLEGREPGGVVPPDRFERVQEEIIDALLDWRDPLNNRRPIALALKLQDAQIIGYWGDVSGDVVFSMNRGYGWGKPVDGGSVGASRIAIHGSQIPTSETPMFSNLACCLLSGPGVKVGYERDWRRWGLMRMIDMAPTFARLLGLRTPRHNVGAVLEDLLEE